MRGSGLEAFLRQRMGICPNSRPQTQKLQALESPSGTVPRTGQRHSELPVDTKAANALQMSADQPASSGLRVKYRLFNGSLYQSP